MPVPAIPNHGLQGDGDRADAGHDQRAEQRQAEPRAGSPASEFASSTPPRPTTRPDARERAEAQRQPPAGAERHPEQRRAEVAGDDPADHGVGADQAAVVAVGERVHGRVLHLARQDFLVQQRRDRRRGRGRGGQLQPPSRGSARRRPRGGRARAAGRRRARQRARASGRARLRPAPERRGSPRVGPRAAAGAEGG